MGAVSSFLKPLKENIKYRLRWRYLWKDWFLGRHACLGYDVLKHFENLPIEVNFQKGRADLLMGYWEGSKLFPKSNQLSRAMARHDVLPLIRQLEYFDCLPKRPPKFILMDSFAELTDQLFSNKEQGWEFCCGYSDLLHTSELDHQYLSFGHLPLENLEDAYRKLFNLFNSRWGDVPILFLHFPIALETRDLYIERYTRISESIDSIALTMPNLISIRIDENLVARPTNVNDELRDFPYHYSPDTYLLFKNAINHKLNLQALY